jgi:putative thioredoxin
MALAPGMSRLEIASIRTHLPRMETFVRDVTAATFERDVIEASHAIPVLVDFWAAWCAPCRALKPVLEKLAMEHAGAFVLAKVDTDAEQEVARRFGIRGIPNVKAFVDGRVVDEFAGALPETAVRAFIARLLPGDAEKRRRHAARLLAAGDVAAAETALNEALELEPGHAQARVDLAGLLFAGGRVEEAERALDAIPIRERSAEADALAARIAFWRKAQTLESAQELEAAVAARPDDRDALLRLAERHVADGRYEAALERLLEVVQADRGELREKARKAMIDVFARAAAEPDLVSTYRRRLSSALY